MATCVQMMLGTYAAWLEGSRGSDIAAIEAAMNGRCVAGRVAELGPIYTDPLGAPGFATNIGAAKRKSRI